MSCNKFEKFGLLYFYEELGTQETQEFKKHLKECEVCCNKLKELKDTVDLYKELPEEEPSPIILKKILESIAETRPRESRKFSLRIPAINIFQNISCPAFVPRILWTGVGAMAILIVAGYFFPQSPNPYLEWESGIDNRIELVEEEIYDLHKEAGILGGMDKVFLNLENGIGEVREKIKNLEKELQSEGIFRF